ncbi:MAG: hypothetical protein AAF211_13165 [Myxococcota bacterium]
MSRGIWISIGVVVVVAVVVGVVGFGGVDPVGPATRDPSAGSVEGVVAPAGGTVDGGFAVRPLVTGARGGGDATGGGSEAEGVDGAPAEPVRGIRAGEPPTLEDVRVAFATFDKIDLEPESSPDDVSRWDREASARLHQKTLALRELVDLVDSGIDSGSVTGADARSVLRDTRARISETMADAPVPSHIEDDDGAELWQLQVVDQALALVDPVDPEDVEE